VDGLIERFKDKINIVVIDFTNSQTQPLRQQLGITDRSQYVLTDENGTVLMRWFGFLDEDALIAELEQFAAQ
jgi:hypothetical protein